MSQSIEPILEDGSPPVSWGNIYKMSIFHGPPVAVTHIITPRDEHVSKVFYFDGKSHTAFGLALGYADGMPEERFAKVIAMGMVLQSIPGTIDCANLFDLGHGDDVKNAHGAGKNVVYHFLAPDKSTLSITRESDGMLAFEQSADFIEEEECDVRIITEGDPLGNER